jgi:ProP effector
MTVTKQDMDAALARLAACFPQTFVRERHLPHRPLKAGIAAEILARCPDLDRRVLAEALSAYAMRIMYLQSLVAGAARVDLDGNACGEVSVEDAEHAAARLSKILAVREAGQALVAASRAARIVRPAAATAPPLAAAPVAAAPAKVSTLKERPVLRLPAFRQG